MSSDKPIDTPRANNIHMSSTFAPQSEAKKEYLSRVLYPTIVGSLMNVVVCARPNLAHVVSVFSRFIRQPGKEHCEVLKRNSLLP